MPNPSIRTVAARIGAGILISLLLVGGARAASVIACLGSGQPDLAGGFQCRFDDTSGGVEIGQYLYVDFQDRRGDEVSRILLDLAPSNARINAQGLVGFPAHTAGVSVSPLQQTPTVYEAALFGLTDTVDDFYLAFNFDPAVGYVGIPEGADYAGATLTVTTRFGRQFTCPFHRVDPFTASTDRRYNGLGLRFRPAAWLFPCHELPSIKRDLELVRQLDAAVQRVERDFCEANPDSPLCH